jgi:hypothetical protein
MHSWDLEAVLAFQGRKACDKHHLSVLNDGTHLWESMLTVRRTYCYRLLFRGRQAFVLAAFE